MNKKVLVEVILAIVIVLAAGGLILQLGMPDRLSNEEKTQITTLVQDFGKNL